MVLSTLSYRPRIGQEFIIVYESDWRLAAYTYEQFTRTSVVNNFDRRGNYHAETVQIVNMHHRAYPAAYVGQIWQRGHLISANNWAGWQETIDQTFVMPNIVPQDQDMNQNVWPIIEDFGHDILDDFPSVRCTTGTIIDGPVQFMNGIAIPTH